MALSLDLMAGEFLEPCSEGTSGYHERVETLIDMASQTTRKNALSLVRRPSFAVESGVRLDDRNLVHAVRFKESLWSEGRRLNATLDFSGVQVPVLNDQAPIAPELAERIRRTFGQAILSSRRSERFGLDGVSYSFTLPDAGCASAWSPEPESRSGQLVHLMKLLDAHANAPDPVESEGRIAALLDVLQNVKPAP
ncbi:hypothetical protein [Pseudomonas mangrovi]|uniref:Uncharacterized protein n=1 Tax=Pseudomonas mangrovi TaxID=2161748 RepID=A0A2T5PFS3_9PSED|nr:hypothetical protein [Pseudomonas mangrovi]PTU76588.1 hypothetical protein DBO85_00010 [Pseudomonas mangrovi]